MQVRWQWKKFQNLTKKDLHQIYMLRGSVLCEEQGKAFQDPDEKDHDSRHLLCLKPTDQFSEPTLIAYARIPYRKANNSKLVVERVVVHKDYRGPEKGIEKQLMCEIIAKINNRYPKHPAYIYVPSDKFSKDLPQLYGEFGFKFINTHKMQDAEEASENITAVARIMKREAFTQRKEHDVKEIAEDKATDSKAMTLAKIGLGAAMTFGLCFFAGRSESVVETSSVAMKPQLS